MAPTRISGIEYAPMPKAGSRASTLVWPPRIVVIHDTGNNGSTRYNEASYAATRTDSSSKWTSAHCYTDPGGVLGSLPLNLQAWAAFSYANAHGFHIEMCRTAAGVLPATIANTTPIVRWLCQQAGIPMVKLSPADVAAGKSGICGHLDITIGLGVGDHEDPGRNFDWATFMAQVTGGDDMDQSEKVTGLNNRGNRVGDVLADVSNQRDWWYYPPGTPGNNPPPAGSRADLVLKAAQKVLAAEAATISDAQAAAMADRIAAALIARPDNPLGVADKPAIVSAVKQALREGVAGA